MLVQLFNYYINVFYEYKHLANSKKGKSYNMFLYQKTRESNIEDWYVELYENFPCL